MPEAMSEADIMTAMDLSSIKNRQWAIFRVSALKGEGLNEAFEW